MRFSVVVAIACLSVAGLSAADDVKAAIRKNTEIPAQGLGPALQMLAKEHGFQIVYVSDEVNSLRTQGASGELTSEEALAQILLGTGLTFRSFGDNAVSIVPVATRATSSSDAASMERMKESAGWFQRLRLAQVDEGERVASSSEQEADSESPHQNVSTLEEIIVTANKRAERLIDVPASVSAVSGDTLTSIGATRLEDYVAKVPGLVLSNVSFANGSNQLTIRGITTGFGGNPTVGIYIDDSPFGASTGFGAFQIPDLDPSDLARVEVLRGPQGTLYGAGAMGGLLKYVTTSPDTNAFFGRVQVDGSQVDGGGSGYGVRGTANIPLTETLALRVGGYDREDPGFIDDADRPVHDINSVHVYGGRAALAWKINDSWNAKLSTLLQRQTADGSAIVDHDSITFRPVDGDLQQVRAPRTGETSGKLATYDLQLEGDLGWANLSTSSSYNQQDVGINLDVTAAYGPLIEANFGVPNGGASILTDGKLEKFTQEIRLSSPDSDGALSWLVGAFYTHEDQDLHQSIVTFDASTGGPLASPLPSFLDAFVFSTFEELAGFGNLTYRFNDLVDVTFGLRYSHNEQSQLETLEGLLTGSERIVGESSDSSLTYLVTPRFHLSDATMFYVRVASGYRPGGPNLAVAGAPPSYEPDEVVNYEAGLKTELLDRQLSLDIAAFYIDWKDIQLNQRNEQGLNYFGNAGAATSKGVEAAATWRATQGLRLSANVNYTIAELAADLPPGTEVASDGDDLPTTPRWNGQFSADYDFPLWGDRNGFAGTSYRYVGNSSGYFSSPDLPRYQLPSYDVVDLRAGVKSDRWMLTLYAKNIGDTRGQVAGYLLGGVNRVSIIQPRTFGMSLSSSF